MRDRCVTVLLRADSHLAWLGRQNKILAHKLRCISHSLGIRRKKSHFTA